MMEKRKKASFRESENSENKKNHLIWFVNGYYLSNKKRQSFGEIF